MDIDFSASNVDVSGSCSSPMGVEITAINIDKEQVLKSFTPTEIVEIIDKNMLLNAIGIDAAKKHFNITEDLHSF